MPSPLQKALFCPCGSPAPPKAPLCPRCRQHLANSRRRFGGLRLAILQRDRRLCAACGSLPLRPHVHHRRPGCQEPAQLRLSATHWQRKVKGHKITACSILV